MKPVNINGVILTEEAIEELLFLQTVSEINPPSGYSNSGLEDKIESVDKVSNFIIENVDSLESYPKTVLDILGDLNYLRKTLKKFRVTEWEVNDGK